MKVTRYIFPPELRSIGLGRIPKKLYVAKSAYSVGLGATPRKAVLSLRRSMIRDKKSGLQ